MGLRVQPIVITQGKKILGNGLKLWSPNNLSIAEKISKIVISKWGYHTHWLTSCQCIARSFICKWMDGPVVSPYAACFSFVHYSSVIPKAYHIFIYELDCKIWVETAIDPKKLYPQSMLKRKWLCFLIWQGIYQN